MQDLAFSTFSLPVAHPLTENFLGKFASCILMALHYYVQLGLVKDWSEDTLLWTCLLLLQNWKKVELYVASI
jgi:hypothetical protein